MYNFEQQSTFTVEHGLTEIESDAHTVGGRYDFNFQAVPVFEIEASVNIETMKMNN